MKTRKGFVTNSSSSSFILAYNKESFDKDIKSQLQSHYDDEQVKEYMSALKRFIQKEDSLSIENLEEYLSKSLYYKCKYEIENDLEYNKGMNYFEIMDFLKTDEGEKMVQSLMKKEIKKTLLDCKEYDTIKKITIHDDYEPYSSMEYTVVPSLNECKLKISHH